MSRQKTELPSHHVELLSGPGFGKYEGEMKDGRYHGQGRIAYDKSYYEGTFNNGDMHGAGTLHVEGGKWVGVWRRGKMEEGNFVFNDGLDHKPIDRRYWLYCSPEDPRFYSEITDDVQLGKPLRYETAGGETTRRLPPGCYDCGDCYYDAKKIAYCSFDTMEPIRLPTKEEKEFIVANYRVQK